MRDLALTVDGERLRLRLVSTQGPKTEEMKEGLGEIQLELDARVPSASGPHRTLIFDSYHQSAISAYLVNALLPRDPDLQVTRQSRNYQHSLYRLDYLQDGAGSDLLVVSHRGLAGLSRAWTSGATRIPAVAAAEPTLSLAA